MIMSSNIEPILAKRSQKETSPIGEASLFLRAWVNLGYSRIATFGRSLLSRSLHGNLRSHYRSYLGGRLFCRNHRGVRLIVLQSNVHRNITHRANSSFATNSITLSALISHSCPKVKRPLLMLLQA